MSDMGARGRFLSGLDRLSARTPAELTGAPYNDRGEQLAPTLHWLRRLRALVNPGGLPLHDPVLARQRFRDDILSLTPRARPGVGEVQNLVLPGPDGLLQARLYRPRVDDGPRALLVFFHGGGFVIGDLDTHDDACRLLCMESGLQVLSVAYRLAPETPFPGPYLDALAAVQWAQDHAARFGVLADSIAVGGDSAGGTLSAVVTQTLTREGRPPRAQLMIYAGVDRTTARPSHTLFGEGFFLSKKDREAFFGHYLAGHEALAHDIRVSPLQNPAPGLLPPALVVSAGFDMLRDESLAYVDYLRQHDCAVSSLYFAELGHTFLNFTGIHAGSEQATRKIGRALRKLLLESARPR